MILKTPRASIHCGGMERQCSWWSLPHFGAGEPRHLSQPLDSCLTKIKQKHIIRNIKLLILPSFASFLVSSDSVLGKKTDILRVTLCHFSRRSLTALLAAGPSHLGKGVPDSNDPHAQSDNFFARKAVLYPEWQDVPGCAHWMPGLHAGYIGNQVKRNRCLRQTGTPSGWVSFNALKQKIPVHLEALECFLNGLHVFAHQFESKHVQNLLRALLLCDVAGRNWKGAGNITKPWSCLGILGGWIVLD